MKRGQKLYILILVLGLVTFLAADLIGQGNWTTEISYDATDRIQYVGKAVPGSATSASLWLIMRITYVGATSAIADVTYAEGDATHKWIWDDRATYDYS